MTSGRSVLIAFGIALVIFVLTHLAPIPGSLRDLMSVNGGHAILDQQPEFSAQGVYERIDAFGEDGRALYQRFLLTTDIVFPMSLLVFMFLFARFSAERFGSWPLLRVLLPVIALTWFAFDMIENLSIVTLLLDYPVRDNMIASYVGPVTLAKRLMLIASIVMPTALLLYTFGKRYISR